MVSATDMGCVCAPDDVRYNYDMVLQIGQCAGVMTDMRKSVASSDGGPAAPPRDRTGGIHRVSTSAADANTRDCDSPGCAADGKHRAPKSPSRLTEYYWFCLDHVREYNKAWNYYAGMDDAAIERDLRRATTWDRPSWPFGTRRDPDARVSGDRFDDMFGVFGADSGASRQQSQDAGRRYGRAVAQALAVMGLTPPVNLETLKARYKILVKRNHPDRHDGSRDAEERLKLINGAYTTLKGFIS